MNRAWRYTFAILVAGGLLCTALFFGARAALLGPFFRKIEADVSVRTRLIQEHLAKSMLLARAVQRHLQVGEIADAQEFQAFAHPFLDEESSLDSLAWIPLVSRKDRLLFEKQMQKIVRPDFRIYENDGAGRPVPAGDRAFYCPILFTVVLDAETSLPAGFDAATDPIHFAALVRARDSALPSVTDLGIQSAGSKTEGFATYFPVYTEAEPPGTPDGRRAATRGFVAAVFVPETLIRAALKPTKPIGLPFDLFDVSKPSRRRLVHRWTARLQLTPSWKKFLYSPAPTYAQRFLFADREWEVQASPNTAYLEQNHPLGHWFLLLSGLLLTVFLAGSFHKQFSQRERLRALNKTLELEIDERKKAEASLQSLLQELQAALANVKTLEGILPICASCKKIRDDKGYWTQVESYVSRHTTVKFSHGICPECAKKLYPEYADRISED